MTAVPVPEETLTLYGVSFETLEVPTATEASAGFRGEYVAVLSDQANSAYDREIGYRGELSRDAGEVVAAWVNPAHLLRVSISATSDKGVAAATVKTLPLWGNRRQRGRYMTMVFEYHHGGVVEFGPDDESNPDLRYRICAYNLRLVGLA